MRLILVFIVVTLPALVGCGLMMKGNPEHMGRMTKPMIPDIYAAMLNGYEKGCEAYKKGQSRDAYRVCEEYEKYLSGMKKSCEETKAGTAKYPNYDSCKGLEIYEQKYINQPTQGVVKGF